MSAFPSLPLFTDAWVADTKHLTRLERGTYHDLIVLMWRSPNCRVPNDDIWLSKRLSMTLTEVANELKSLIAEFCECDGNWITQKRLSKEWAWCKKNSKQRSDAAKSRWHKEKTPSKRNANTHDARNAPILSSPNKEERTYIKPPEVEPKITKKKIGPIPEGWQEPARASEIAKEIGVRLEDVTPRFRDYIASSGKQYADYDAAYCNFVRNTPKFNGNTGPPRKSTSLKETKQQDWQNARAKLKEFISDGAGQSGDGSGSLDGILPAITRQ